MERESENVPRYFVVRGAVTLWKGDPDHAGSKFRQIVITSKEFNLTDGVFQVYCLEGEAKGIAGVEPGHLTIPYDKDFDGLQSAQEKMKGLVVASQALGFKVFTIF